MNRPILDSISGEYTEIIGNLVFDQPFAQPKEPSQLSVDFLRQTVQLHRQQHPALLRFNRLPEHQRADLRRHFPMDLVQAVTRSKLPKLMIFRKTSTMLRMPGLGEIL